MIIIIVVIIILQIFFQIWNNICVCSFKVYVADIESHEAVRSRLNECAFHVISRGSDSCYARKVKEQQQQLNERWRALCQLLGITYKKAEETKYGLKLLEIQLKQLNAWMTELEERLRSFTRKGSCEISEIQKQLGMLKVQWGFHLFLQSKIINPYMVVPFCFVLAFAISFLFFSNRILRLIKKT